MSSLYPGQKANQIAKATEKKIPICLPEIETS
jgi:hypothetical protein